MYAHGAQIEGRKMMQNLEVEFLSQVLKTLADINDAISVVKEIRSKLENRQQTLAIKVLVDASRIVKEIDLPLFSNSKINEAVSTIKAQYVARGHKETAYGFEYRSPPRIGLTDAKDFVYLCQQVFKL